eukprot:scaffold142013_cov31-Tisochrysis_lutea.AAC.6
MQAGGVASDLLVQLSAMEKGNIGVKVSQHCLPFKTCIQISLRGFEPSKAPFANQRREWHRDPQYEELRSHIEAELADTVTLKVEEGSKCAPKSHDDIITHESALLRRIGHRAREF